MTDARSTGISIGGFTKIPINADQSEYYEELRQACEKLSQHPEIQRVLRGTLDGDTADSAPKTDTIPGWTTAAGADDIPTYVLDGYRNNLEIAGTLRATGQAVDLDDESSSETSNADTWARVRTSDFLKAYSHFHLLGLKQEPRPDWENFLRSLNAQPQTDSAEDRTGQDGSNDETGKQPSVPTRVFDESTRLQMERLQKDFMDIETGLNQSASLRSQVELRGTLEQSARRINLLLAACSVGTIVALVTAALSNQSN
ncbi:hypothetical protein BD324DRAFT_215524 [Kockovaella imperatae]|uniref:Uncharacterized protein n=1 Tax=Kockovaella imperatae TaxID=4999 RepID=A0A1Y1U6B3_9TREE|nr:hypothetical protein BD324DRAFT_215524 [Kockovaella imperatae]ORX33573.1 hypothetical protein BD324DRAFT_215524 [Kockovaella imperatae]